jgi:quercetin dioxygenase-like cupin family protein
MQYVFPISKAKHYRFPTHVNDLVMDRSESKTSEVFVVVLEPGEAPPRHKHDDTEQVFHVLSGKGRLWIEGEAQEFPVQPGDVVRIPVGAYHRIFCEGNQTLRYLSIDCFIGGRPAAEPTWEAHVRNMCKEQGFDYEKVTKASGR